MSDFEQLRAANLRRAGEAMRQWSPNDFAVAVVGEMGEACNLLKKIRRADTPGEQFSRPEERGEDAGKEMITEAGEELADTVIYLDLLAAKLGIDLWAEIVLKFNATSRRIGSPERLTIA